MPVCRSLRPAWQKNVEGLDKLIDVLTLWKERFQEMQKIGKLKVSRDAVRTLIQYLRLILGELDRSKEVERLVATVLEIADTGTKKKNIGWQIRTAIEECLDKPFDDRRISFRDCGVLARIPAIASARSRHGSTSIRARCSGSAALSTQARPYDTSRGGNS
jgi:hypothetical protein